MTSQSTQPRFLDWSEDGEFDLEAYTTAHRPSIFAQSPNIDVAAVPRSWADEDEDEEEFDIETYRQTMDLTFDPQSFAFQSFQSIPEAHNSMNECSEENDEGYNTAEEIYDPTHDISYECTDYDLSGYVSQEPYSVAIRAINITEGDGSREGYYDIWRDWRYSLQQPPSHLKYSSLVPSRLSQARGREDIAAIITRKTSSASQEYQTGEGIEEHAGEVVDEAFSEIQDLTSKAPDETSNEVKDQKEASCPIHLPNSSLSDTPVYQKISAVTIGLRSFDTPSKLVYKPSPLPHAADISTISKKCASISWRKMSAIGMCTLENLVPLPTLWILSAARQMIE